jgi:uncharacterized protein (TIGR02594 family)
MPVANSYIGTTEIRGSKHNPKILEFFDHAGHGWVKNDETAWCAAFVNAMLHEAGVVGSGSLAARSFLKWGKKTSKPKYGDIVVFWRGSKKSWQGHVAFFVRETSKYVYVLGGNQRNSVNVARYPKSKVLGYRVPSSLKNSRTVAATSTGVVTSGAQVVLDSVQKTQETLMGMPVDYLQYIAAGLTLVSLAAVVYFRWDDLATKGR